jgi:heparosan-N-sulfate-glucuronate 5-epimerase
VIFATVGTHGDGFSRMLAALETLGGDEDLVVQYGHGRPPANATRAAAFLPFAEMMRLFTEADKVVTHAGVGSILLASRSGHVPVIVPRLARHREHVDDHQVELARALESRGGVVVCWEAADLARLVAGVPGRDDARVTGPRPLATAVGEVLRLSGSPGKALTVGANVAGRRGRLTTAAVTRRTRLTQMAADSVGAYLEIGTGFTPQPLGVRINPRGLSGYYCDFSHKVSPEEQRPGTWLAAALAGERWRSPMAVSQAALGFWERQLAGEDTAERFLALADWLLRYGDRDGPGLTWAHEYAVPKYGLAPGWRSGMTQGEAISVLLRAHALSGEDRYRDAASAAFHPFTVDVLAGGVVRTHDGALVIEEYPATELIAVLNGWIFGLIGLHELSLVEGRPEVADTFHRARSGLLALLPRYDVGWWSRYSLGDYARPDLAKPFYQRLHVVLLDGLHLAAPDPLLSSTARRWEGQIDRRAMVRIAADKVTFRIRRALPV